MKKVGRRKGKKTEKLRYKLELFNLITDKVIHTQLFTTLQEIADILEISYQQTQRIKYGKNIKMKKYARITKI